MQDRTLLITGATAGIGRATALHCAKAGARIVASGRRVEEGHELIEEIRVDGGEAIFVKADVTRADDVRALVSAAVQHYGSLDFAFNNAGIFQREPVLHEYDDEVWQQHIAVGLTGVYQCMKYQLRAMLDALRLDGKPQHRAIINNASIVGLRGSQSSGAGYTAVKHGMIGLTRQAAIEYAQTPVRINAICPGPTLSEATAPLLAQDEEQRTGFLAGLNPTAQLIAAEEIAATVQWLCSDAARMVNGHALPLDGGQLAKL